MARKSDVIARNPVLRYLFIFNMVKSLKIFKSTLGKSRVCKQASLITKLQGTKIADNPPDREI